MKQPELKPKGVFVIVDENKYMHKIYLRCLKELKLDNQVVSCHNGQEAFSYLKDTKDKIFMILSEITMPKIDGHELKRMINMTPELHSKAIPFFYLSEVHLEAVIKAAYGMGIQGYFRKSADIEKLLKILTCIFDFWTLCVHPKNLK